METIDLLRRRIATTAELQDIVRIMKTIAAVNIRQYLRAVESLADYHRTIEMGFQVLLREPLEVAVRRNGLGAGAPRAVGTRKRRMRLPDCVPGVGTGGRNLRCDYRERIGNL